jgi:hypothetical protein
MPQLRLRRPLTIGGQVHNNVPKRAYILLIVLWLLLDFAVATVTIAENTHAYQGGYANGTIHFTAKCQPLADNLLRRYSERPMTFQTYTTIEQLLARCDRENAN